MQRIGCGDGFVNEQWLAGINAGDLESESMNASSLAAGDVQVDIESKIRTLITTTGLEAGAECLDRSDDLFDAGLTSHASVRLMLALEDAFDVEFPDEMLQREYFSSVSAIVGAINSLLEGSGG
ncbi:MAG: acyl carrier protein [Pseudomonadales bacterium]